MADITIPIAFVAGVLTFLSPCILPLVPAFISYLAGISIGAKDEFGRPAAHPRGKILLNALFFVIGFSLVFSLLGVLLANILSTVALEARTYLTIVGGAIIAGFGVYLILANLGVRIPILGSEHRWQPRRFKSNYLTSFVFGVAFAAGWTPCIGAVLGGILTIAIIEPGSALELMLAFSLGIGVPFLIAGAFISQFSAFISRFAGFMRYFSLAMGGILIAVGLLIVTGYLGSLSVLLPVQLAEFENIVVPADVGATAPAQSTSVAEKSAAEASPSEEGGGQYLSVDEKSRMFQEAPELAGIAGYINTDDNISIRKLTEEGNVVLVDFWTYSCINCQRTIPYLNAWYDKYSKDGLVIIGVHSPEFAFEKVHENVANAVDSFGIKYPVVQDNDFQTWRAYGNSYWPRKYIVDIDGFVRYDHIGEGSYAETESVIQDLLKERMDRFQMESELDTGMAAPENAEEVDFSQIGTPEIYFGHNFLPGRNYIGNFEQSKLDKASEYELPPQSEWKENFAYLGGAWSMKGDFSQLHGGPGKIGIKYSAKRVNIVAGGTGNITSYVDGEKVRTVQIDGDKLYNLVSSESYGSRTLELDIESDVRIFTFTFG